MVRKIKGNLLDAKAEALVNTVNTVGIMGRGIALQFKKAMPAEYFSAYEKACRSGELQIGRVQVFDAGGLYGARYVINFPTKKHWKGNSKIEWIHSGLASLVDTVTRLGIRSIALPPLGCGLGGLDWNEVYRAINTSFASLPDVDVMAYEPAGVPDPTSMKDRTSRPKMTAGRAVVLGLMDRYLVPGFTYLLSLLEAQKLVYFQMEAGEQLRQMEFARGEFGPYADTLRHVLEKMDRHFIEGYGDGQNKPDTSIRLVPQAAAEARQFLSSPDHKESLDRLDRVMKLIEGFETPYGMELLSSVHWVATHENPPARNAEEAVTRVHAWNERKARVLRGDHIRLAWDTLVARGWINSPVPGQGEVNGDIGRGQSPRA